MKGNLMNEIETPAPAPEEVVVKNSRKMKRINRRYMMSTVGRGVKWGLIAVGTLTVLKSFVPNKDETSSEEEK